MNLQAFSGDEAMPRRRWLGGLLVAGGALALTGCGFKLKQAPQFAFRTIHLGTAAGSNIGSSLRRQLEGSKQVRVVPVAEAELLLDVLSEQRERVVVGLNANGEVRELQIRSRFRFRVRSHDELDLVPETELLREMDVSYAEAQALAKDAEVEMLFKSMEADTVQQIVRRLAMIKHVNPMPGAVAVPAQAAASKSGW